MTGDLVKDSKTGEMEYEVDFKFKRTSILVHTPFSEYVRTIQDFVDRLGEDLEPVETTGA